MGLDVILPVYGLALLDTLSPATIGISVYVILTTQRRTAWLLFTYLATVALFYFRLGTGLMIGLDAALGSLGDVVESRTGYLIQAGIGAALFVGCWFVPTGKKPGHDDRRERRAGRAHTVPAMVGLGITTGLVEAAPPLSGGDRHHDRGRPGHRPVGADAGRLQPGHVLPPMLMYAIRLLAGERVTAATPFHRGVLYTMFRTPNVEESTPRWNSSSWPAPA